MKKILYPNTNNKCTANTLSCLFDNPYFADAAKDDDKDWGLTIAGSQILVMSNGGLIAETFLANIESGVNISIKNIQNKMPNDSVFVALLLHLKTPSGVGHAVAICISRSQIKLIDTNNQNILDITFNYKLPKILRAAYILSTENYQPIAFNKADFGHIF